MISFSLLILAVVIFLLQACAAPPQGSAVSLHLYPMHTEIMSQAESNIAEARLLDNDGNMYSTFWDLGVNEEASFLKKLDVCDQQIKDRELFKQYVELFQINLNDLQPSLFKEHTRCIESQGFALKNTEAFLPKKFMLSIYRGHSKTSSYMPVGGTYYLGKKSTSFADVYKQVAECAVKIKNTEGGGVIEKYMDDATYVNIEPYVILMQSCLTSFGYVISTDSFVQFKSLQNMQDNDPSNTKQPLPDLIKFENF